MRISFKLAALAAIAFAMAGAVQAQENLPVPGYGAARDVPGGQVPPNPNIEHKVVFDAAMAAENVDDVNPMLVAVARYVNTLAKFGVPPEKRKIAIVFHQGAGTVVLKNDAFKALNDGHDNPNIKLLKDLNAAGVSLHVCGQGVMARNIDPKDILEEVQLDVWALTTLIDFGQKGYVRIGG
jgi:intracellular sulfur oxidation DsrE/DsrF family protein